MRKRYISRPGLATISKILGRKQEYEKKGKINHCEVHSAFDRAEYTESQKLTL